MGTELDGNHMQSLAELDRLVHEPGRLLVMACLYVVEQADYLYVLKQTGLTQGNLSSHLTKLESGGYLKAEKSFQGKVPRTQLALTNTGREAFRKYRAQIVKALSDLPA
ncbi:MAG: transcriptional regulator [Bryobacterales bacterium]|nr:transcriptional regulator [Bryobacterales bacterium]